MPRARVVVDREPSKTEYQVWIFERITGAERIVGKHEHQINAELSARAYVQDGRATYAVVREVRMVALTEMRLVEDDAVERPTTRLVQSSIESVDEVQAHYEMPDLPPDIQNPNVDIGSGKPGKSKK